MLTVQTFTRWWSSSPQLPLARSWSGKLLPERLPPHLHPALQRSHTAPAACAGPCEQQVRESRHQAGPPEGDRGSTPPAGTREGWHCCCCCCCHRTGQRLAGSSGRQHRNNSIHILELGFIYRIIARHSWMTYIIQVRPLSATASREGTPQG